MIVVSRRSIWESALFLYARLAIDQLGKMIPNLPFITHAVIQSPVTKLRSRSEQGLDVTRHQQLFDLSEPLDLI